MQVLKSELFATSNPYKFDEVPDYLDNSIEKHPAYSLTTYFVKPSKFCLTLTIESINLTDLPSEQPQFVATAEVSNYLQLRVLGRDCISRPATVRNIYDACHFIEMQLRNRDTRKQIVCLRWVSWFASLV